MSLFSMIRAEPRRARELGRVDVPVSRTDRLKGVLGMKTNMNAGRILTERRASPKQRLETRLFRLFNRHALKEIT